MIWRLKFAIRTYKDSSFLWHLLLYLFKQDEKLIYNDLTFEDIRRILLTNSTQEFVDLKNNHVHIKEGIQVQNSNLTLCTLQYLIRIGCERNESLKEAKFWLKTMKNLGFPPTLPDYLNIINQTINLKDFVDARVYIMKLIEDGLNPTINNIDEYLRNMSNIKLDLVETFYQESFSEGYFEKNKNNYNWLLLSYAKRNDTSHVAKYFNEMWYNKRIYPDSLSFQSLIAAQIGIYGDSRKYPNYAEVLRVALNVYYIMKRDFCLQPNSFINYSLLRRIVSPTFEFKLDDYSVLCELTEGLLLSCQKENNLIRDRVNEKFLLRIFDNLLLHKYLKEAQLIYKEFCKQESENGMEICAKKLLETYANLYDPNTAKIFLFELISKKFMPHPRFYRLILEGYLDNNDLISALNFYEIIKEHGIIPNEVSYLKFIKILVYNQEIKKAKEIFKDIVQFYKEPCIEIFNTIIHGFYIMNDNISAQDFIKDMKTNYHIKPNISTYNVQIQGYGRVKWCSIKGFEKIYENMINDGIQPDTITYRNLIVTSIKLGHIEGAKKYFQENVKSQVKVNFRGGITLMNALAATGKKSDMRFCWDIYQKLKASFAGKKVDRQVFETLLFGIYKSESLKMIELVKEEIEKNGYNIDVLSKFLVK
ncbi:3829_t:CDS:2 [Diversispora eburnea]|uniref:3829_t:CDS:1 n=1 Tax=Diversispora eburnea TaxID=1213867 RepID=A0A9N8V340_9GLOM|nr:3829_t:CDS:2 [Diversispora eburnea]